MIVRDFYIKLTNSYYKYKIKKQASKVGKDLYIGGKSFVTKNTYLGDGVCFNGMSSLGNGRVTIFILDMVVK